MIDDREAQLFLDLAATIRGLRNTLGMVQESLDSTATALELMLPRSVWPDAVGAAKPKGRRRQGRSPLTLCS